MIEQRVREELRRLAEQAQADQLRPLRAPARRGWRLAGLRLASWRPAGRRRWLVPAGAALAASVAVLAVVLAEVVAPAGSAVPVTAYGAMPPYYMVVADAPGTSLHAVVRASADGHVTGDVTLPVHVDDGQVVTQWRVAATASDREFAVAVYNRSRTLSNLRVFRMPVSADGHPGAVSETDVRLSGGPTWGMALSPDGTRLALPILAPGRPFAYGIEVVDLGTGQARTWTGDTSGNSGPGGPFWENESTLDVPWWQGIRSSSGPRYTGIRHLDISAPGASLLAVRLDKFRAPVSGLLAMLATGGGALIGVSCNGASNGSLTEIFTRYTSSGGRLSSHTILTEPVPPQRPGSAGSGATAAMTVACAVPSADPSGRHLLVRAPVFGRADDGVFRALPTPPVGSPPDFESAW